MHSVAVFIRFFKRNLCILEPLGRIIFMFGLIMLVPIGLVLSDQDPTQLLLAFLLPSIACIVIGLTMRHYGRELADKFRLRHATLLLLIIWCGLPFIGAFPLRSYVDPASVLSDSYFEAVSGITASGATIMINIDTLPDSIKLWRGLLAWMGGMGLVVLATALLPNLVIGVKHLFNTEISGPQQEAELTPRIEKTAKGLWTLYIILSCTCALAYWISGMDWLDALVHSFTTVSMSGFSNHDASFAYFDSVAIEIIAVLFMLLAGLNFATHFSAIRQLSRRNKTLIKRAHSIRASHFGTYLKLITTSAGISSLFQSFSTPYRQDNELRSYLTVLFIGCVAVIFALGQTTDLNWTQQLRHGIFNTVSIATTTGYSNTDFGSQWPLFISFFILLLANFTSCSGSTGGGIKMIRARTALGILSLEGTRILRPNVFLQVRIRRQVIDNKVVSSVLLFLFAYTLTMLVLGLTLLAVQPSLDFLTAISAALACLSNTGPGLGDVGSGTTYTSLNPVATTVCAFAMLLGRLELLLFLVLFTRDLWR